MAAPRDIPLRIARDRLLDLLQIGDSYPLTDLDVAADSTKVPYGGSAVISIERAQAGVVYRLCDAGGRPLAATEQSSFEAQGDGAKAKLATPPAAADASYRVRAMKASWDAAATEPHFLRQPVRIRVGLNEGLELAFVGSGLVAYGASAEMEVRGTQEGVQYQLLVDGAEVAGAVQTGNLREVRLRTGSLHEDAVLTVRATKTLLASGNRVASSMLRGSLRAKVMADPSFAVSAAPAVVPYYGQATLRLAGTQASARYRAYVRALPDADFVHGDAGATKVAKVAVSGKNDAQIRLPAPIGAWGAPEGYAPAGDAVPGTGGELELPLGPLADDAIVIVQALKEHRAGPDDKAPAVSAVGSDQAAVVLVGPDPAPRLVLRVAMNGKQTGDAMQASDGQPGVYYYFRPAPDGAEIPLPAYFHKRDDRDRSQNKGVGQLTVGVDLAIAADPEAAIADRATTPPPLPLLAVAPLAADASLAVRAVKAQSGVEVKLAREALIAATPAIRAEPPAVDAGSAATILIPASDPRDRYQVLLNGVAVKPAMADDKSDLAVATDPLQADAVFEVVVTRAADEGPFVERVVAVPVAVRPKAGA